MKNILSVLVAVVGVVCIVFGVLFIMIVLLFPGGILDIFTRIRHFVTGRTGRPPEDAGTSSGETDTTG